MREKRYNEISTKRTRPRKRRGSTLESAPSTSAGSGKSAADFLSYTKRLLIETFAEVMDTIAQRSIEGSLPHVKYLFEIGGVKEELLRQIQNNGEPSVAELLLAEVKRYQKAGLSSPTAAAADANGEVKSEVWNNPGLPVSNCGAEG